MMTTVMMTRVMAVWSAMDAPPGEVEPDPAVLGDAVAGELGVESAELSAQQLGARSLRLRTQIDSLRVALARTDAEFEKRRAFRELDPSCTKASQWLAEQLRVPIRQARVPYLQARRLAQLPALQTALIAGVISWWHACTIAKAASSPARVRRLRTDLATLVDGATTLAARDFARRMTIWVQEHFHAEAESDAVAAEEARTVSVGRNESAQATLSARLHPVFGTEVLTELARIERRLFELDWLQAKAVHGDATRFEHLARTSEQRRADALVEMARRVAAPGVATMDRPSKTTADCAASPTTKAGAAIPISARCRGSTPRTTGPASRRGGPMSSPRPG